MARFPPCEATHTIAGGARRDRALTRGFESICERQRVMEDGQTERQSLARTGLRGTEDVALVAHRFLDSLLAGERALKIAAPSA